MRFNNTSKALTTTALYSNGTWLMVLPILFVGGTLHVQSQFNPLEFLKTVHNEKITHTFAVPIQYQMILDHEDYNNYDLSSLNTMLSAGSLLRQDLKKRVLTEMGEGLYELYGCSEGLATMIKPEEHKIKPGNFFFFLIIILIIIFNNYF